MPDLSDLPKKPRVRIRVSNTKPAQLKRLMTKVQKMAKIQESVITRVDGLSTEKVRDKKINIGDVNNDSLINILDIVAIINFILDINQPDDCSSFVSDLNNDQLINVLDIIQIINLILGSSRENSDLADGNAEIYLNQKGNDLVITLDSAVPVSGVQISFKTDESLNIEMKDASNDL